MKLYCLNCKDEVSQQHVLNNKQHEVVLSQEHHVMTIQQEIHGVNGE